MYTSIHIASTTWTVMFVFVLTLELSILFLSIKFKTNLTVKVVHFPSNFNLNLDFLLYHNV